MFYNSSLAIIALSLCAAPLSGYPSIKQLSEFQVCSKWYELGLHFNILKTKMKDIRKSPHPITETFLAAKVKNVELNWKDVIEGLLTVGESGVPT